MSAERFTLTGTENLKQIFRQFPEGGYRKPIIAGFRKAAKPVADAFAAALPSDLRKLKKIIKIKPGKGKSMTLSVGFTGGISTYRNSRGQDWDPWQLVYWFNYGTLANRLASHQFKTPRRKVSAARSGGIRPRQFVEAAWENSKDEAQRTFETEVDKEIIKFMERLAAK